MHTNSRSPSLIGLRGALPRAQRVAKELPEEIDPLAAQLARGIAAQLARGVAARQSRVDGGSKAREQGPVESRQRFERPA